MIFLVGRTCSGKSTIARKLADKYGMEIVKSYTTRPMRDGETEENADHIFIKPEEVGQYKDKIVAYTKIGEYEYFATSDMIHDNSVYIIDPNGIYDFKLRAPEILNKALIMYVRVGRIEQLKRAVKRGEKIITTIKRMISENRQFSDYENRLPMETPFIVSDFRTAELVITINTMMKSWTND